MNFTKRGRAAAEYKKSPAPADVRRAYSSLAESGGFEPPGPCGPIDFKSITIDHSDNSPFTKEYYSGFQPPAQAGGVLRPHAALCLKTACDIDLENTPLPEYSGGGTGFCTVCFLSSAASAQHKRRKRKQRKRTHARAASRTGFRARFAAWFVRRGRLFARRSRPRVD